MFDDRVRAVLARLEEEDRREREAGLPAAQRSRQVTPATGRFLFTVVAPQSGVSVLEIGGSRGYSTIWLAAAARILGGTVLSLESDPLKCEAWLANIEEAGLGEWAELVQGDAFETLKAIEDIYDVVFLDSEKDDYEAQFGLVRDKIEPGGLVIADNVVSHDVLHAYSAARQTDPTLVSVTVPLDRGLELSAALSVPSLRS
jgi:predicted O-methyltransferase YrrM